MTGRGGEVVRCRGKHCFAAIRWAQTVDGKWMPVDPDPTPEGTLVWSLTGREWRLRVIGQAEQIPDGTRRFRPHWVTCPDSALMRVREVFPDAQVIDPGNTRPQR